MSAILPPDDALERLNVVARDISGALEPQVVFEKLAAHLTEALRASSGYMLDVNKTAGTVIVLAEYWSAHATTLERKSDLGRVYYMRDYPASLYTISEQAIVNVRATDDDCSPAERASMVEYGIQAKLYIPVVDQGEVIGQSEIWESRWARTFTPSEIRLAQAISQLAAGVIKSSRLLVAARRHAAELDTVLQISLSLVSRLELKAVLENVVSGAMGLFKNAHDTHLYLYTPETDTLTFGSAFWDGRLQTKPISMPRPGGLTYTVARAGQAIIIPNVREHPLFANTPADWVGATIALPLLIGGRVVGVMNSWYNAPRPFSADELRVMRLLADQAAIAIENASLFESVRHAQKAAEEANRSKSAFLATMSHEIRTPMNAIIGLTEMVLQTPLTPQQHDYIDTVRVSGDILLTIINDILDFSKIEANRLEIERQPFNLRDCAQSAIDLITLSAQRKGLAVSARFAPDVPHHWLGDPTRLRQILVNLLNNAVKFTERGEINVCVAVQSQTILNPKPDSPISGARLSDDIGHRTLDFEQPPDVELLFSVRDTGLGIPANRADRLFQPFSQLDASTARKFGGTGLGLAISKRLAEMMGGTMWLESAGLPGQGTTFYFTITGHPPTAEDTPPAATSASPTTTRPTPLPPLRLLLAEDNLINQKVAAVILDRLGQHADLANSGLEVLDALGRSPYDVILMDVQMPDMDGLETTRRVRALGNRIPQPYIIAMTANAMQGDREMCLAAGMDGYLSKPIRLEALAHALRGAPAAS
jgi:signal transduction histidine kinase/CheY-like chemotaxis protein